MLSDPSGECKYCRRLTDGGLVISHPGGVEVGIAPEMYEDPSLKIAVSLFDARIFPTQADTHQFAVSPIVHLQLAKGGNILSSAPGNSSLRVHFPVMHQALYPRVEL